MQKEKKANSLNLLLDMNKKIVQVSVDGGRPGEAEKISEKSHRLEGSFLS